MHTATVARRWFTLQPAAVTWLLVLALSVLGIQVAGAVEGAPAARVASARGEVTAQAVDGSTRRLTQGGPVYSGERVSTGARASVQLTFTDESRVNLGADGEITVDEYRAGADGSFVVGITKGVFRVITGLIGSSRPESVQVRTRVATIGIRGTHFGGAADETSAVVVLLEPEGSKPTAIQVSNRFGAVTIDQPGLGTEVPDANSPPSPPRRMRLRAIDNLIRSFSAFPR